MTALSSPYLPARMELLARTEEQVTEYQASGNQPRYLILSEIWCP
jgi:hypothetical protein